MNSKEERKPVFSVTASDCEWSYTKGSGSGGQKKNKTSSAVHCHHKPSGARGYSEASRSQLDNRRDAFKKMAETKEFKQWARLEFNRLTGVEAEIDRKVEQELKKVLVEVKNNEGKWEKAVDL